MAKQRQATVSDGVYEADQGFQTVRQLETTKLELYLSVYEARIANYLLEENDWGYRFTMRIDFPNTQNRENVNLWSFFIATASHHLPKKGVDIRVEPNGDGLKAYVSWAFFPDVKFIESKHHGRPSF